MTDRDYRPAGLLAACFLAALAPRPVFAAGEAWRTQFAQAQALAAQGQGAQAAAAAEGAWTASSRAPGPIEAEAIQILAFLADAYHETGDAPSLAGVERRLGAIGDRTYEASLALSRVLRYREEFPQARIAAARALSLRSGDVAARVELALADEELGRNAEAAKALEDVLRAKPRMYALDIQLAKLYARMGRADEAKERFARAKRLGGDQSAAYIAEGYFLDDAGDDARATASFRHLIAVDTASPDGYVHLGSYLFTHHRFGEAEENFREALELLRAHPPENPDEPLHAMGWLGRAVLNQGRAGEAESIFREGLGRARGKTHYEAFFSRLLGDLCAARGETRPAEDYYRRAVAACGEASCSRIVEADALCSLANFELDRGRRAPAQALAARAWDRIGAAPVSSDLPVLDELARLYARLGGNDKAEKLFGDVVAASRATPFSTDLAQAQDGLADLALRRGRFAEAETLYLKSLPAWERLGGKKEEARALEGLASAYESEGKHGEAVSARGRASALAAP
ncbi:MAG: tetratricopeptide repeat protein [Elusimicrobiota bacterium]